jgi:cytochrome c oxidase assembly protein subunit 23
MGKETPDEAAASWTGPTADKFEKCAVPPHLLRDHGTDSTLDSKQYSQYFDPCQEAAQKSIRCLHRNGGDREMCSDFFQYEALATTHHTPRLLFGLAKCLDIPKTYCAPSVSHTDTCVGPIETAKNNGYVLLSSRAPHLTPRPALPLSRPKLRLALAGCPFTLALYL